MEELFSNNILLSLLAAGGVLVALITTIKEVVLWILNRRAKVSDDKKKSDSEKDTFREDTEEDITETKEALSSVLEAVEKLSSKTEISTIGMRLILQDRVKFLALKYINDEEIYYEDREFLKTMWNTYHFDLGGNGGLDPLMKQIDELPLKYRE